MLLRFFLRRNFTNSVSKTEVQVPKNLVGGKVIKGTPNSIILPNSIRLPEQAVLMKEADIEEKFK